MLKCDSGAMTQRNGTPADLPQCCGVLFCGEFGLVWFFGCFGGGFGVVVVVV